MKPIKVLLNENFLKNIKQYPKEEGWLIDWRSPRGCLFQDARIIGTNNWLTMTPESIFEYFKEHPNNKVQLSLIGNCKRWYSTCKIKNIYVEVWK